MVQSIAAAMWPRPTRCGLDTARRRRSNPSAQAACPPGIHGVESVRSNTRIIFANQLRGLCVLCVVLVHYTTVVQYFRRDVSWVVAAPPLTGPISPVAIWVYPPWLDLGKFGVATFFLISGFVIPFSLQRSGAGRFLLARALRIYPTFWAALLIEAAVIVASSRYWHRPPAYGIGSYLVNGLLVETLLGRPAVDWVSWTLSIEVKFYLLAALLRTVLLRFRVWPLLAVAAGALLLSVLEERGVIRLPPDLVSEAMYLGFILIGTLFHYHHEGVLSTRTLVVGVLALLVLFFLSYALGPNALAFHSPHTASFAIAVAVFAACYRLRQRFRPNRALDALAAISYPLYLIHAIVGFTTINFLVLGCGLPYGLAAILAVLFAMALAGALHRLVERPTIHFGHRLRRRTQSSVPSVSGLTT